MYVVAKMTCQSIEDWGYNRKIKLTCVHDSGLNIGDSPENRAFTKATPSGECWMTVDNKYVWPAFSLPVNGDGVHDWQAASSHYVLFMDAKEHSLEDVHRAIAALESATVDN